MSAVCNLPVALEFSLMQARVRNIEKKEGKDRALVRRWTADVAYSIPNPIVHFGSTSHERSRRNDAPSCSARAHVA